MDLRPASAADSAEIADVARGSFGTSYSLSPLGIDTILERVFSESAPADRLDDPDAVMVVAEGENGEEAEGLLGFAEAEFGDAAALRWLHVDPNARGMGAGTALMERVREEFDHRDPSFVARVLEAASEGSEFLERFGLAQSDTATLSFDREEFREHVYTAGVDTDDANEPSVEVPDTLTADGEEVRVDQGDRVPGDGAPFFAVFGDEGSEGRWGYVCSNCGSTEVSADGLDRLACNDCGNEHRADEWDGAYL